MKVFFSYAREDESLAHLLAYVLEKTGGFECVFDRDLRPGRSFDIELRQMINQADLVLVLLTKWSLESPWVNQEIGFAIALKKAVYPLAIQAGIEPDGMIKMCHKCSLFDWSNSKQTIEKLIGDLRREGPGRAARGKHVPLDINLESTYARADFLIENLTRLVGNPTPKRVVRQQAAFSIFATSDDPAYRKAGGHPEDYMKLLLEERRLTDKLVRSRKNEYRLILWPVRHYSAKYQAVRFANLLKWLDEISAAQNIDIRCGEFQEPANRLIVSDDFVLDGFKAQPSAGFGYSEVHFQPEWIEQATEEFDATWNSFKHNKAEAIELLRAMHAGSDLFIRQPRRKQLAN